jgi:dephospho-CoA kinase
MEAQADDASRSAVADDMVYNDGNTTRLEARVQDLHQQYLALAG